MLRDLEQSKGGPEGQTAQVAKVPPPVNRQIGWLRVLAFLLGAALLLAGGWWIGREGSPVVPSGTGDDEIKAHAVATDVVSPPDMQASSSDGGAAEMAGGARTSEPSQHAKDAGVDKQAESPRAAEPARKDTAVAAVPATATATAADNRAASPREPVRRTREPKVSSQDEPTPAVSTKTRLDPRKRAQALWRQARRQPTQAESLLREALALDPDLHAVRVEWVVLLVRAGRTEEAESVVDAGLKRPAPSPALVEWKARLALSRGDAGTALRWLLAHQPVLEENLSYYGLEASLLAREGRHQEAINLYRQLLRLQPDHGRWWLGLALSSEKLGQRQQAVDAYQKALASSGLTQKARAFVQQKLASLATEESHGN
jgi:MSHA biogenesis protein MshN